MPRTSESVTYLVETALNELLQNVVEHAESPTDAVVLARWYKQDKNVRIAIADSGIGFAESLRRNPRNASVYSDANLVRRAITEEGTTGRPSGRFGGLGLKNLYQVCLHREGSVHVSSRTVDASFRMGKESDLFVPELDGTTLEVDFRPGPETEPRADSEPEDFF